MSNLEIIWLKCPCKAKDGEPDSWCVCCRGEGIYPQVVTESKVREGE